MLISEFSVVNMGCRVDQDSLLYEVGLLAFSCKPHLVFRRVLEVKSLASHTPCHRLIVSIGSILVLVIICIQIFEAYYVMHSQQDVMQRISCFVILSTNYRDLKPLKKPTRFELLSFYFYPSIGQA